MLIEPLRNFGLKMGQVSKARFEARVWELANGNPMLEAAVTPILRLRIELRDELAVLEKLLGPVEIHRVRIIVAPMWIMASKLVSVLQARIAIRLNSLSF